MVTAPEAAALLAHASSFDNRKPDAGAARAWAAALSDIDFADAMEAIVAHYANSREWIMPADIRDYVRRIEKDRAANSPDVYELEPPQWVTDLEGEAHDAAYLAWVKEQARRVRRGEPLEVGPARVPSPRQLVS